MTSALRRDPAVALPARTTYHHEQQIGHIGLIARREVGCSVEATTPPRR
jgi:hypothetical protein